MTIIKELEVRGRERVGVRLFKHSAHAKIISSGTSLVSRDSMRSAEHLELEGAKVSRTSLQFKIRELYSYSMFNSFSA